MRRRALLAAAIALTPALAPAEEPNPLVYERITVMPPPDAFMVRPGASVRAIFTGPPEVRGKPVRIELNSAIPAGANDGGEVDQIRRHVRRWIYDRSLRECHRLLANGAQECRLHAIGVSVRHRLEAGGTYLITGDVTLATKPK